MNRKKEPENALWVMTNECLSYLNFTISTIKQKVNA